MQRRGGGGGFNGPRNMKHMIYAARPGKGLYDPIIMKLLSYKHTLLIHWQLMPTADSQSYRLGAGKETTREGGMEALSTNHSRCKNSHISRVEQYLYGVHSICNIFGREINGGSYTVYMYGFCTLNSINACTLQ